MADIYEPNCAACGKMFKAGQLVVPVERIQWVRNGRIEVTEKGFVAHQKCPEDEEDEYIPTCGKAIHVHVNLSGGPVTIPNRFCILAKGHLGKCKSN